MLNRRAFLSQTALAASANPSARVSGRLQSYTALMPGSLALAEFRLVEGHIARRAVTNLGRPVRSWWSRTSVSTLRADTTAGAAVPWESSCRSAATPQPAPSFVKSMRVTVWPVAAAKTVSPSNRA